MISFEDYVEQRLREHRIHRDGPWTRIPEEWIRSAVRQIHRVQKPSDITAVLMDPVMFDDAIDKPIDVGRTQLLFRGIRVVPSVLAKEGALLVVNLTGGADSDQG